MRYHYEKPQIYLSMYGVRYVCEHPVYNSCTLFLIGDKGLAVIQQRFDVRTKTTWWSEVDSWLTDDLCDLPNGPHRIRKRQHNGYFERGILFWTTHTKRFIFMSIARNASMKRTQKTKSLVLNA